LNNPFPTARDLLIDAPIDDRYAVTIIAKLLFLNMQNTNVPINLYINCPGGSATASLAIIDTIAGLQAPVHTYAFGRCQGSALLILAVGRRGQRLALSDSVLSIEVTQPGTSVPQSSAQLYLPKLNNRMAAILTQHTRLTFEQALAALAEGRPFTPEEALEFGIIDVVGHPDT